jgi:hypothetical protein
VSGELPRSPDRHGISSPTAERHVVRAGGSAALENTVLDQCRTVKEEAKGSVGGRQSVRWGVTRSDAERAEVSRVLIEDTPAHENGGAARAVPSAPARKPAPRKQPRIRFPDGVPLPETPSEPAVTVVLISRPGSRAGGRTCES